MYTSAIFLSFALLIFSIPISAEPTTIDVEDVVGYQQIGNPEAPGLIHHGRVPIHRHRGCHDPLDCARMKQKTTLHPNGKYKFTTTQESKQTTDAIVKRKQLHIREIKLNDTVVPSQSSSLEASNIFQKRENGKEGANSELKIVKTTENHEKENDVVVQVVVQNETLTSFPNPNQPSNLPNEEKSKENNG